jgi:hypothetical protein
VVAGIVFGAVGQLALTSLAVGSQVMAAYAQALRSLPRIADVLEPTPGDSLRSLFKLVAPSPTVASILYGTFALATVLVVSTIWRSRASIEIRHAALLLGLVLISPHVGSYDLLLLAPVYFLLANWLARTPDANHRAALAGLLSASFVAPICGGLPAMIRIHLSVSAMAALIILLWRIVNESERTARLMPASSRVHVLDQHFA